MNKIANVIFAVAFGALAGVAMAHGLARYL